MIYVDVNVFKNDKTFDLKFDETMSVSQMLTELKAYIKCGEYVCIFQKPEKGAFTDEDI